MANPKTGVKVANFNSPRSNSPVANQYRIWTEDGVFFQSYDKIIAFKPFGNSTDTDLRIQLDSNYWDYSNTTGKYRNEFLREDKRTTERKIKEGEYVLTNLNY